MREQSHKVSAQVVGNIGLYWTCSESSKRGWNVMPTARNAKGIDVIIYDQSGKTYRSMQVKTMSKPSNVQLNLDVYFDFLVIPILSESSGPVPLILRFDEIRQGIRVYDDKNWLQTRHYLRHKDSDWQKVGHGWPEAISTLDKEEIQ